MIAHGAELRAAEVAALKVCDIDGERMLLRVERCKGGIATPCSRSGCWLFCGSGGGSTGAKASCMSTAGSFPDSITSSRSARDKSTGLVVEAVHAAGIDKRVGPHTLRHCFAIHSLEDGIDVRIVEVLLGHAKLETTAYYTQVATRVLRNVISPSDRLTTAIREAITSSS